MPFDLEKPTYCSKCDPHRERDNVLSPYERLIICFVGTDGREAKIHSVTMT